MNIQIQFFTYFLIFVLFKLSFLATAQENNLNPDDCISQTKFHHTFGIHKYDHEIDAEETLKICTKLTKLYPENSEIIFGLARSHQLLKNYDQAYNFYLKSFEKGFAEAASQIGIMYSGGYGRPVSYKNSLEWYEKGIIKGSIESLYLIGTLYEYGKYVYTDYEKAKEYYLKAIEKDHSGAILHLASSYSNGELNLEFDIEEAKNLYFKEFERGNPEAIVKLAYLKLNDTSEQIDVINSLEILKEYAVNKKFYGAFREYANLNLVPESIDGIKSYYPKFEPDIENAFNLVMQNSNNFKDIGFIDELVWMDMIDILTEQQKISLISKLESIVNNSSNELRSSMRAAEILGDIYVYGKLGPPDIEKAVNYLTKASNLGSDYASINLGWYYYTEPKILDFDLAVKFSLRAGEGQDPYYSASAFNNLGVFYEHEEHENFELAAKYYKKSSEIIEKDDLDLSWPSENLARIYIFGKLKTGIDFENAYYYAEIAKKNGSDYFKYLLDRNDLNDNTTEDDIKSWLIDSALDGRTTGLIEMGWISRGNAVDSVKWHTLCSFFCENDEDVRMSEEELTILKSNITSNEYNLGRQSARDWRKNVWEINIAANTAVGDNSPKKPEKNIPNLIRKNFALLIGVSDYIHLTSLRTPLIDIGELSNVLETKYNYEVELLENPTREEVIKSLNLYKSILNPNDNFFIYYAGHGISEDEEGFWLPRDADLEEDTNWISNSYLKRKLKSLKANNIIIIADSCFSGKLLRGLSINENNESEDFIEVFQNTKSRVAISSGGDEPVMDGGGGKHSVFAKLFIEKLNDFNAPFTSMELYSNIRNDVLNYSLTAGNPQTPFYGELLQAGHEGPDYVFVPIN